MTLTVAHITPLVALIAGILILLMPRLLNYIVAIYLILIGLIGLNNISSLHALRAASCARRMACFASNSVGACWRVAPRRARSSEVVDPLPCCIHDQIPINPRTA
jgi:hypothetical protein